MAELICFDYGFPFSEKKEEKLLELYRSIRDVNPQDYTMRKISTLTTRDDINYAQINIGRGWTP